MADQDNLWFRLGYTLESARLRAARPPRLRSPGERTEAIVVEQDEPRAARKVGAAQRMRPERDEPSELEEDEDLEDAGAPAETETGGFLKGISPTGEPWEAVVSALSAALVGRLLDAMPRKRRPGPIRLFHAAAAGATAAVARELLRPMISGAVSDRPLVERARGAALAGSARGLLYGALVEPRLPGPPFVRGTAYGIVEHLVSPMGGLLTLAGPRAPHRSLPFVSGFFEELEESDDSLLDHVVFGVALAALYGARPADVDREEDEDEDDEED